MTVSAPVRPNSCFGRGIALLGALGIVALALGQSGDSADSVVQRLRERDNRFNTYRVSGVAQLAIFENALDPKLLAYSRDPDKERLAKPHWTKSTARFSTETAGDNWRYSSSGENGLQYSNSADDPLISPGLVVFKKQDKVPVSANLSVVAGRHPALGLGLGDVIDAHVEKSGSKLVLTGTIPERGQIKAVFRDSASLELESLHYQIHSNSIDYQYGPYFAVGDVRSPKTVQCNFKLERGGPWNATYTIDSIDFGASPVHAAPKWFLPGYAIVDERLEEPVRFEYSELLALNHGSTDLTAARLLQFSAQKLKKQQFQTQAKATSTRANWTPYAVGTSLFLGVGALAIFRKRR